MIASARSLSLRSCRFTPVLDRVSRSLPETVCDFAGRRAVSYRSAIYGEHGNPALVTSFQDSSELTPKSDQVVIKFMASPINPSDINQIEGTYAICPPLPAVPGNEGIACIESIPEGCNTDLKVGDWVIPASPGFGTWRTHAVAKPEQLIRIRSDLPLYSAATLAINPVTAYRLLHDFVRLKPGSTIIQNAANSSVGLCVIQIARLLNVTTINVIRDRDDFDAVKEHLLHLGADHVVKEGDIEQLKQLPKPVLAFNAVGGKSSMNLARSLARGGQIITYGGMSRKPLSVPTGLLIFSDIVLRGFWLTRTNQTASKEQKLDILQKLMDMILQGRLKVDVEPMPFRNLSEALDRALQGKRKGKVVLTFD